MRDCKSHYGPTQIQNDTHRRPTILPRHACTHEAIRRIVTIPKSHRETLSQIASLAGIRKQNIHSVCVSPLNGFDCFDRTRAIPRGVWPSSPSFHLHLQHSTIVRSRLNSSIAAHSVSSGCCGMSTRVLHNGQEPCLLNHCCTHASCQKQCPQGNFQVVSRGAKDSLQIAQQTSLLSSATSFQSARLHFPRGDVPHGGFGTTSQPFESCSFPSGWPASTWLAPSLPSLKCDAKGTVI
mmetsp:Transcript_118998/g.188469  ORF Transcript_118998/g.188469 Transcript_118998/m.188469 type:complete len:237 (+) Transcript_118998:115-825(+)